MSNKQKLFSLDKIIEYILEKDERHLLLAGPPGIGKTTIACGLRKIDNTFVHIELDKLKENISCSSIHYFSISKCLEPEIKDTKDYIIDVGGDSIFRKNSNVPELLKSVEMFKDIHSIYIILLSADEDIVKQRYMEFPGSFEDMFTDSWKNWKSFCEPNWEKCCDERLEIA